MQGGCEGGEHRILLLIIGYSGNGLPASSIGARASLCHSSALGGHMPEKGSYYKARQVIEGHTAEITFWSAACPACPPLRVEEPIQTALGSWWSSLPAPLYRKEKGGWSKDGSRQLHSLPSPLMNNGAFPLLPPPLQHPAWGGERGPPWNSFPLHVREVYKRAQRVTREAEERLGGGRR